MQSIDRPFSRIFPKNNCSFYQSQTIISRSEHHHNGVSPYILDGPDCCCGWSAHDSVRHFSILINMQSSAYLDLVRYIISNMDRSNKAFHAWCQDPSNSAMIHQHLYTLFEQTKIDASKRKDVPTTSIDEDASSEQLADATEGG